MKRFCIHLAVVSLSVLAQAGALEERLFTVQQDGRECGSAFLMQDGDSVWMVSNCHVVQGDRKVEFIGMVDESRTYDLPESFEVAANHDAIRFKVPDQAGFRLADDCAFDESVFAFGNSGGAGVVTKSEGKVVGKGRGEIEVTCEIIPGNSGGPVINTNDDVVGISTFIITAPSKKYSSESAQLMKVLETRKGTRYEETRRFAVPLHDAQWQPVEKDVFVKESVKAEDFMDKATRFDAIVRAVFLCRPISIENEDILSRGWIRTYLRNLDDYGHYYSSGNQYMIQSGRKDAFFRAFRRWMTGLNGSADAMAGEFSKESDKFSILFFQRQLSDESKELETTAKSLLEVADKLDQ
ncbi:MAG: serine protease [Kiritimatiellales bacterium]